MTARPYTVATLAAPVMENAMSEAAYEMADDECEAVARRLWFEFVDSLGYPNGQPTWDEMSAWPADDPDNRCAEYLRLAAAAIDTLAYYKAQKATWSATDESGTYRGLPIDGAAHD